MGKGAKELTIPFSPRTGQALWRYLTSRQDVRANDPLIATQDGHEINRSRLLKILVKVGNKAGISNVHPHRFRHPSNTRAIAAIRTPRKLYSLKLILTPPTSVPRR